MQFSLGFPGAATLRLGRVKGGSKGVVVALMVGSEEVSWASLAWGLLG